MCTFASDGTSKFPTWRAITGGGPCVFLAACTALGISEVASRQTLSSLSRLEVSTGSLVAVCSTSLIIFGLAGLIPRFRSIAYLAIAGSWIILSLLATATLFRGPADVTSWVKPTEGIVLSFTAAYLGIANQKPNPLPILRILLRITYGSMLILFGSIHLLHSDLIASLIPSWVPVATSWPMVTGPLLCGAGVAFLVGRFVEVASLGVAAMFASWLPIVHAERIIKTPSDAFEWTFAITALALVGAALTIADDSSLRRVR
jgi:uncharacterized membrane protein